MRKANLNALETLLLSMVLMAATPITAVSAQQNEEGNFNGSAAQENFTPEAVVNGGDTAPSNAEPPTQAARILKLENQFNKIESLQKATEGNGPLGVVWPLWLAGGSSLIGLIALILSMRASGRSKKLRAEVLKLKGQNQSLLMRIGGVETQIEQERMVQKNLAMKAEAPKPSPIPPQPSPSITWSIPVPVLDPQPAPVMGPAPVSKASLINTLNAGDRQPLREATTAELNITSESENALAMGRANSTELEEVPGGGSYWLVSLQGQHWLFPTDRTLKGFAAAQPAKGLFDYEQQTIAQPQLVEPALLENSGTRWSVKTIGRIAVP
ncbi:MAG: hypothetical protein HQ469_00055 [Cyanobacteria bacterium]|nr:hypothetical protein [Cyanobacteria bacterium bin.275]